MQNRSFNDLPIYYSDSHVPWNLAEVKNAKPSALDMFDVAYLHYHQQLELGLCVKGTGVCYVNDMEFAFKEGDIEVVLPYQYHLSKSTGGTHSLWLWLFLDLNDILINCGYMERVSDWLSNGIGLCGIIDPADYPNVTWYIKRLFFPACTNEENDIWLVSNLLGLLTELHHSSLALPKLMIPSNGQTLQFVIPALEEIEASLSKSYSPMVSELSALCGMSVASFRRNFKSALKMSPKDYITASRMRRARQLLVRSNMKISEISEAVGYNDLSVFNKTFLNYHRMSPTGYRQIYSNI